MAQNKIKTGLGKDKEECTLLNPCVSKRCTMLLINLASLASDGLNWKEKKTGKRC